MNSDASKRHLQMAYGSLGLRDEEANGQELALLQNGRSKDLVERNSHSSDRSVYLVLDVYFRFLHYL